MAGIRMWGLWDTPAGRFLCTAVGFLCFWLQHIDVALGTLDWAARHMELGCRALCVWVVGLLGIAAVIFGYGYEALWI